MRAVPEAPRPAWAAVRYAGEPGRVPCGERRERGAGRFDGGWADMLAAMAKKRVLVLNKPVDRDDPSAGVASLGDERDVMDVLARFNTAPDGAESTRLGTKVLFGPGFVVELPLGQDELRQLLVTVIEVETAWPVLSRLTKDRGWVMTDTESGQVFG